MTLCIAAISRKDDKIITVTDFLLSTDTHSLEASAAKVAAITEKRRWLVMYSGDPCARHMVMSTARDQLRGTDESAYKVLAAFRKGFEVPSGAHALITKYLDWDVASDSGK